MTDLLQFLASGLANGAVYALIGIGFSVIYSASRVINFAQGEFVMIGGMASVFLLTRLDVGLPLAVVVAIGVAVVTGLVLERVVTGLAKSATVVAMIIVTIGASILLRGLVEAGLGKQFYRLPPFSGEQPITLAGAVIQTQTLWVVGTLAVVVVALKLFFTRTRLGKALRATAENPLAAALVGIEVRTVLAVSFGLSALLGALGGILTAPITLTHYDIGSVLGLKGFCAAILGGLASPFGAVAGGLALGLVEVVAAGYLSSAYKDAVAFLLILATLLYRPSGLFAGRLAERV